VNGFMLVCTVAPVNIRALSPCLGSVRPCLLVMFIHKRLGMCLDDDQCYDIYGLCFYTGFHLTECVS
jgi:hypothetical protein